MDRWLTKSVIADGGLDLTIGILEQGQLYPGTARELINYEPADDKGYRKILGYTKFSSTAVTGDSSAPILGVSPYNSGVVAVRKTSTDYAVYYSTGTSWTKINTATRTNAVSRARFANYSITTPVIIIVDGANYALKWNGSSDTLINGTGAPSNPKYAVEFLRRLVLAGYSVNPSAISLSAPDADTDFTAASGAIELSVGDTVTGLITFRQQLYIFCRRSIHVLEGSTSSDFIVRPITKNIGAFEDTIQEVAGDVIFLAQDGIRSLTATDKYGDVEVPLESKQIQDLIVGVIKSVPANFSSIVIPSKSQYRLFYHITNKDDLSQRGLITKYRPTERWNYHWSEIVGFPVYCCNHGVLNDGSQLQVFGHVSNGTVYKMEDSGGLDGAAISFSYVTPPLTFDDIEVRKVLFRVNLALSPEQDTEISIRAILDEFSDRGRVQPSAKTVRFDGDGAEFGTAIFDTSTFANDSLPFMKKINMEGSGNTITFAIFGSNTELPHTLDSYSIEYSVKGRR